MISAEDLNDTRNILDRIDRQYECIGCLAHGGFGSVFLAKTRNKGRHVALKVMPMDTRDDEEYKTFIREVDSVVKLNTASENENARDDRALSIIYFEDWYISHTFVCICMEYADGGTLAQEIQRKATSTPFEPYTERRIVWYALQLADALAFAHERGVAHHDVKSRNILIDASKGGKLLLADFGTSVKPGEECSGFTRSYAPSELIASYELDDFTQLRHDKTDGYALGCVLYELLMCDILENASKSQTLAEFIDTNGLEAAMMLPHMKLPWISHNDQNYMGYSGWLKQLVMSLLHPIVNDRYVPSDLVGPLRSEQSPLLEPYVRAAREPETGAAITVDNVQLGLLVQRGCHWDDGDDDGGVGSIGVITKLDPDVLFTWVTFPSTLDPICCRIGSNGKFEIQVAPDVNDLLLERMPHYGVCKTEEKRLPGYMINSNWLVVGSDNSRGSLFVAPMRRITLPPQPSPNIWRTDRNMLVPPIPIEYNTHPDSWDLNLGPFVNVGQEEWDTVLSLFYGDHEPDNQKLSESENPVEKVQRVQNSWLWESYARRKGMVALENWGVHNELRAFIACENELAASNLHNFQSSGKVFSTNAHLIHERFNLKSTPSLLQMVLCRVVVGRVHEGRSNDQRQHPVSIEKCHSKSISRNLFACHGTCLAYPEYIITYRDKSGRANRVPENTAISSENSDSNRSPTKMCVICMEQPVKHAMIPCGHICLCRACNAPSMLKKLKKHCPECRARFSSTIAIYGRIVDDE